MDTEKLVIYKEAKKIINIDDDDINTYKNMGYSMLMLSLPKRIDPYLVDDLLSLNEKLNRENITLMINLSIYDLGSRLINKPVKVNDPRLERASLTFISFLVKRGIGAIGIRDLDYIYKKDRGGFIAKSSQISKNIKKSAKDLSLVGFTDNLDETRIRSLAGGHSLGFDFFVSNKDFRASDRINLALSLDEKELLKYKLDNFKIYIKTSLIAQTYLKKGPILIDHMKEDPLVIKFIKEVFQIKREYKALAYGKTRKLLKKYEDISVFERSFENQKVLVISKLSQGDIFIDPSLYIADFKSYKFLLGNYGKRSIFKSLILRSFETIILVKEGA